MSNPFIRAYEFEKRYGIDRLKLTLEKAEQAYKTHEPETIDFCQTSLDCICKTILAERDQLDCLGKRPSFQAIVGETLTILNLKKDSIHGGISQLAKGLGEIRNHESIAAHGSAENKPALSACEIDMYVSNFSHIVNVILTLLDADEIDISTTRMTFDAVETELNLADINEEIDASVIVEYAPEDGVIFLDGKEIRPSKLLFHYDRAGYNQRIEKAKEEQLTRFEERFREQITDALYGRFENFHPGHYGVDDLEIIFDQVEINDRMAKITGNVSASARLGSSSAEDGMDVDYSSGFKASFNCKDGSDPFELEKLELDVVDWIQPDDLEMYAS